MRILKIELQNINSLKSDSPIVIDFESALFKDVGLFAITGSTGAGKTTVLDAITIAMYHSVPRFNKSNIKAGLEDVVSYGADAAMSRVSFETKGAQYEAFWSMRLKGRGGKRLGTPREEVRLKNLTNQKILAEKKTELKKVVERITQLNYNQFLRSVLLAQGEFAAFLSAKGPEKGALLEQITGEPIYKRIGEITLQKISKELKMLDSIKAKINTEDLLTDETRTLLQEEVSQTQQKQQDLSASAKIYQQVLEWHKQADKFANEQAHLQQEKQTLNAKQESAKDRLQQLAQHEMAMPFLLDIEKLRTFEKQQTQFLAEKDALEKQIVTIHEAVSIAKANEEKVTAVFSKAEQDIKSWQPILAKVTSLDTQVAEIDKSLVPKQDQALELQKMVSKWELTGEKLNTERHQKEAAIKLLEKRMEALQGLSESEPFVAGWQSKLEQRALQLRQLHALSEEYKTNKARLKTDEQKRSSFQKKLEHVEVELKQLENVLKGLNTQQHIPLEGLLKQKDGQEKVLTELKDAIRLSDEHAKHTLKDAQLKNTAAEKREFLAKVKNEHQQGQERLGELQRSMHDAEKIFSQAKVIEDYANERKKLRPNEPCNVCGSKLHPYVNHYETVAVGDAERVWNVRKQQFDDWQKEMQKLKEEWVKVQSELESIEKQGVEIQEWMHSTQRAFSELNSEAAISDHALLQKKFAAARDQLETLKKEIEKEQSIQKQKLEAEHKRERAKDELAKLNMSLSGVLERVALYNKQLEKVKNEGEALKSTVAASNAELSEAFTPFELVVPSDEEAMSFIGQLTQKIKEYRDKEKEHAEMLHQMAQLNKDIGHHQIQISEKKKELAKVQQEMDTLVKHKSETLRLRNDLLPIKISTQQKQDALYVALESAKGNLETAVSKLNNLKQKLATAEKERQNNGASITELKKAYDLQIQNLLTKLSPTVFDSRAELEGALLSDDDKMTLEALRKGLDESTIQVATKEKQLLENLEKHRSAERMDISKEEALIKQGEYEEQNKKLLKRLGEIQERFRKDQEIQERNQTVVTEIQAQEGVVQKWRDLMNLLGGSQSAFNTYVQRLTLQNLISIANVHLFKLNKRYSLRMNPTYKAGEELNFTLVDHYHADETRVVDTSSGGEKFLISLSLALGLSDLASKNVHIGSLYIDEGFGTLDNHTLETVISTLETLQKQGKMIGIISHVDSLKERIPTQIQISKKSNGVSELSVV